jgi:hypothetical protein
MRRLAVAATDSPLFDRALDAPDTAKKAGGIRRGEGQLPSGLCLVLSCVSMFLFVMAGSRVHADRSKRIPVVTWESGGVELAALAAVAGFATFVLSLILLRRSASLKILAFLAMELAVGAALMFLFYLGALYED